MTLEQLIHCDASTLEAMDNATLEKHFKDMFPITRPEMQSSRPSKSTYTAEQLNPKLAQGMNLLKGLGIDVGDALNPIKKTKKPNK